MVVGGCDLIEIKLISDCLTDCLYVCDHVFSVCGIWCLFVSFLAVCFVLHAPMTISMSVCKVLQRVVVVESCVVFVQ